MDKKTATEDKPTRKLVIGETYNIKSPEGRFDQGVLVRNRRDNKCRVLDAPQCAYNVDICLKQGYEFYHVPRVPLTVPQMILAVEGGPTRDRYFGGEGLWVKDQQDIIAALRRLEALEAERPLLVLHSAMLALRLAAVGAVNGKNWPGVNIDNVEEEMRRAGIPVAAKAKL